MTRRVPGFIRIHSAISSQYTHSSLHSQKMHEQFFLLNTALQRKFIWPYNNTVHTSKSKIHPKALNAKVETTYLTRYCLSLQLYPALRRRSDLPAGWRGQQSLIAWKQVCTFDTKTPMKYSTFGIAIYAPMIYTAPMVLMRADPL